MVIGVDAGDTVLIRLMLIYIAPGHFWFVTCVFFIRAAMRNIHNATVSDVSKNLFRYGREFLGLRILLLFILPTLIYVCAGANLFETYHRSSSTEEINRLKTALNSGLSL